MNSASFIIRQLPEYSAPISIQMRIVLRLPANEELALKETASPTVSSPSIFPQMSAFAHITFPRITAFSPTTSFPLVMRSPSNTPSTLMSERDTRLPLTSVPEEILLTSFIWGCSCRAITFCFNCLLGRNYIWITSPCAAVAASIIASLMVG